MPRSAPPSPRPGRLWAGDILVNNAGIGAAGTIEDNDDAEWHRVLDVNVLGIVRTTRAALPLLRQAARERGQAAIVNTCSIAATAGLPQRALYSATKGAVYSLTLAMAADHVAEGIRVNCVTPGTADTPWVGRLLDAAPTRPPNAPRSTRASRWAGWSARTGRRGHRLSGQPARRGHHGHGAGRGRRHARPADPAETGLIRRASGRGMSDQTRHPPRSLSASASCVKPTRRLSDRRRRPWPLGRDETLHSTK